ncbi:MAG TPA: head GIN domain-containing protein [Croceibacterium sp.]
MGALAAGGAALVVGSDFEAGEGPAAFTGPSEKSYTLGGFEAISTSGPQDVQVTLGDRFEVRAEGSPMALAQLEPFILDGKLTIAPKEGFNWGNWRSLSGATFYVTLPKLETVAVAGSGNVRIDRIEGESFEGTIAGSGELSIATMQVDEADFRIGGSGNVVAAGTARETRVSIGGSGEVRGGGLRSQTASVSIGGSGDVELTVEDEADVSIAGSGDVAISGPGRCSVTRFRGGNVRCTGGGGTDD